MLVQHGILPPASMEHEEELVPYIIGAVDGSHISIITPPIDPTSYYCRKSFYSALLQGIEDKASFGILILDGLGDAMIDFLSKY
jgi:hypothetical protein